MLTVSVNYLSICVVILAIAYMDVLYNRAQNRK